MHSLLRPSRNHAPARKRPSRPSGLRCPPTSPCPRRYYPDSSSSPLSPSKNSPPPSPHRRPA
ncbi:MAG: hypothetical protein EI684_17810 [Candidatus Viridilinea halotolerans]|uniref:Uncharacterized protein n=1 Tax=Candidatus Viridilinea halotolerans TaxID=2491704 RepID=A0A426TTS3_9CHLR|nr:MAG: hypothetical protein EI684_17810 [Candidatus Viridilinea halotolerans]